MAEIVTGSECSYLVVMGSLLRTYLAYFKRATLLAYLQAQFWVLGMNFKAPPHTSLFSSDIF